MAHSIDDPVYIDPGLRHYQGNPLIEALPPIMSDEDRAKLLSWDLDEPTDQERSMPPQFRLHLVARIRDLVIVLPEYEMIEPILSIALRRGYENRNPMQASTFAKLYNFNMQAAMRRPIPTESKNPETLMITGLSGTGKTTLIKRLMSQYPQVIQHTQYKGEQCRVRQIVWLVVDCPADGSVKSMSKNFLAATDRLLGTNILQETQRKKFTGFDLLPQMATIAANNFLGVLVLDELQHLKFNAAGGDDKLLNQMASLFNSVSVPIVGIGTPEATNLFSKKLQNIRRIASAGIYPLCVPVGPDDPVWEYFIEQLWRYQWLKSPTKLTRALSEAFYNHCQGIVFFAVALFILCQYRLIIDAGKEKITPELLDDIAVNELSLLQPILRALRSGQDAMRRYEDLLTADKIDELSQLLKMPTVRANMKGSSAVKRPRSENTDKPVSEETSLPESDIRSAGKKQTAYDELMDRGIVAADVTSFKA